MIWQQQTHDREINTPCNIDEWWREVACKILEAIIFKSAKVEPVLAAKIAPWIPPSCRGNVNTEHFKLGSKAENSSTLIGCPKMLAELIRKGVYDPLNLKSTSIQELQEVCLLVGISNLQYTTTKVECNSKLHQNSIPNRFLLYSLK